MSSMWDEWKERNILYGMNVAQYAFSGIMHIMRLRNEIILENQTGLSLYEVVIL